MKTKTTYLSDDGKEYATEEECREADKALAAKKESTAVAEKDQTERKKAADTVKEARKALSEAEKTYDKDVEAIYADYEKEYKTLQERYTAELTDLKKHYNDRLAEAKKPVTEAKKAVNRKLADFCSKWGTYHESYSLKDLDSYLDSWVDSLFDWSPATRAFNRLFW